jgi:hypothetical protein
MNVTSVSCPSLTKFGVMKSHCGFALALTSAVKSLKLRIFGCVGWHRCDKVADYQRVVFAHVERVRSRTANQVVDRRVASIGLEIISTRGKY